MTDLDAIDSALLALLQNDGRRTNRELATMLNIAPSTCLERMRSLRRRGLIVGYHAQVDLAAIGRTLQALIAVRVRPPNRAVIDGFRAFVEELPEVLSVFVVAGGDDFLVQVAVPSVDALHSFLMDRFTGRREIVGFRSSVIYQHVRKPVIEPL